MSQTISQFGKMTVSHSISQKNEIWPVALQKGKKKMKKKNEKQESELASPGPIQIWPGPRFQDLDLVSSRGTTVVLYLLKLPFLKTTVRPWERKKYTLQWEPITGCRPGSASGQSQST